jgi:hypothetical protein
MTRQSLGCTPTWVVITAQKKERSIRLRRHPTRLREDALFMSESGGNERCMAGLLRAGECDKHASSAVSDWPE